MVARFCGAHIGTVVSSYAGSVSVNVLRVSDDEGTDREVALLIDHSGPTVTLALNPTEAAALLERLARAVSVVAADLAAEDGLR
jgi:hypothetical protein